MGGVALHNKSGVNRTPLESSYQKEIHPSVDAFSALRTRATVTEYWKIPPFFSL